MQAFRPRQVAVLVGTTGSYGRGVLRGIAKYNRENNNWATFFQPQMVNDQPPPGLKKWKGDGILTNHASGVYAEMLHKFKVPTIRLRLNNHPKPFPYVGPDHAAVGVAAAEHLQSMGFRRFACYRSNSGSNPGLDQRASAFEAKIKEGGRECDVFIMDVAQMQSNRDESMKKLSEWLNGLSKPIGLMATNDERGMHVLEACRAANINVPAEVAVIGVDNDELMCDLSVPQLTSVDINAERIGYEAAAALDKLMDGGTRSADPVLVLPRGVVTRRSTDAIASEDPELNRAVNFIRENSNKRITVRDVVAHVQLSRTSLQQRMRDVLGCSVHEEIDRSRLLRLKTLLVSSDLTIKQLAKQTGFSSVQYMTRVFHAATGETPARYRQSQRM